MEKKHFCPVLSRGPPNKNGAIMCMPGNCCPFQFFPMSPFYSWHSGLQNYSHANYLCECVENEWRLFWRLCRPPPPPNPRFHFWASFSAILQRPSKGVLWKEKREDLQQICEGPRVVFGYLWRGSLKQLKTQWNIAEATAYFVHMIYFTRTQGSGEWRISTSFHLIERGWFKANK